MMRIILLVLILSAVWVYGHDLQYSVEEKKCIEIKLSFATGEDDFSYQRYEIYAPGENIPFMVGRTDKYSRIFFLPDRPGKWNAKVMGEDGHGKEFVVEVDRHLVAKKKEEAGLLLQTVKMLGGIVLIFAIFYLLNRKERS